MPSRSWSSTISATLKQAQAFCDDQIDKVACLRRCLKATKIRNVREQKAKLRTILIESASTAATAGSKGQRRMHVDEADLEAVSLGDNRITTSKYTLLTFVPKNLYEQFKRVANFYFLINAVILLMLPDPPTTPIANLIPLLIVITVTAVKQAYEDVKRHLEDWQINSLRVIVARNGRLETIKSKDIKCGDIVRVEGDANLPCDILLLQSSSETGNCYVKTANLDGETNLKRKNIPTLFPHLSESDMLDVCGVVKCEKPNTRLYEFKGTLELPNGNIYALNNENLLLRGTTLKVAKFVYGCAIYTGMDTKMMMNSKFKANKRSCIERKLNYFVAVFAIFLVLISILCLVGSISYERLYASHWYLFGREPNSFYSNVHLYRFINFIFYMNLNYLIPLSLYVTLELTRLMGSRFFEWDIQMYDEATDQPAMVNSTDLNEDLGQIEHLFLDKTGTLTENQMVFKHFSIDGHTYEEVNGQLRMLNSNEPLSLKQPKVAKFLEALTLCHTVQVDLESPTTTDADGNPNYNASSPDELSFIQFCVKLGIIYKGDVMDKASKKFYRSVVYNGNDEKKYELLHVLEFDSTRKRMSVIVRECRSGELLLFCKGADSAVFAKSSDEQAKYAGCLKSFSESGWRTLVLAYKTLSKEEYERCDRLIVEASQDILRREERLCEAYEAIESELRLVGVTAVEDKLQESVESTIEALRRAGIRIWVLTGDKLETAINISETCRHFSADMKKHVMANMSDAAQIRARLDKIARKVDKRRRGGGAPSALVVDGFTLAHVFENSECESTFRDVAMSCTAVLCCRMSPKQKAQVVRLVKESDEKPMTAAVGDGANDVSMIQEAHVGIGIFGKEGRNAARAADFAFARFKHLRRALLVHGYLFYTRCSLLVLYFFYKNLIFAICQAYFASFNALSSTSLYSPLYISSYNLALTSVPVFFMALLEKRKPMEKLDTDPFYYTTITKNRMLTFAQFTKWNLIAIWHSCIAFFLPVLLFSVNSVLFVSGVTSGLVNLGQYVVLLVVIISHIKIFLVWKYQTWYALLSYAISFVMCLVIFVLPQAFIAFSPFTSFTEDQTLYYSFFVLLSSASVWLSIFLAVVTAILPDLCLSLLEDLYEQRKKRLGRDVFRQLVAPRHLSLPAKILWWIRVKLCFAEATGNKVASENVASKPASRPASRPASSNSKPKSPTQKTNPKIQQVKPASPNNSTLIEPKHYKIYDRKKT